MGGDKNTFPLTKSNIFKRCLCKQLIANYNQAMKRYLKEIAIPETKELHNHFEISFLQ